MLEFLSLLIHALAAPFRTQAQLEAEITMLRHLWLPKLLPRRSIAFQLNFRPNGPRSKILDATVGVVS
jgi:hypothetical protein